MSGKVKPRLRGRSHAVGFFVALIAGATLVALTPLQGGPRIGVVIYTLGLALLTRDTAADRHDGLDLMVQARGIFAKDHSVSVKTAAVVSRDPATHTVTTADARFTVHVAVETLY